MERINKYIKHLLCSYLLLDKFTLYRAVVLYGAPGLHIPIAKTRVEFNNKMRHKVQNL